MSDQDLTLVCAQCGAEFVFTAAQQERFARKGYRHPPKLCKACYDAKRQQEGGERRTGGGGGGSSGAGGRRRGGGAGRSGGDGTYRSPAFQDSAPEHQGPRGGGPRGGQRHRPGYRASDEYRSPAFRDSEPRGRSVYTAPGFRDRGDSDSEYRAPGFRDRQEGESEYRSVAFREHDGIDPRSEYRAPGFQDIKERYRDERPMFRLVCARCGKSSMVPFLPEEREEPLCDDCYRAGPPPEGSPGSEGTPGAGESA